MSAYPCFVRMSQQTRDLLHELHDIKDWLRNLLPGLDYHISRAETLMAWLMYAATKSDTARLFKNMEYDMKWPSPEWILHLRQQLLNGTVSITQPLDALADVEALVQSWQQQCGQRDRGVRLHTGLTCVAGLHQHLLHERHVCEAAVAMLRLKLSGSDLCATLAQGKTTTAQAMLRGLTSQAMRLKLMAGVQQSATALVRRLTLTSACEDLMQSTESAL